MVDLLGLKEATHSDFKLLTDALCQKFAPSAGHQELMFSLNRCEQELSETLEDYVDLLILLTYRAYVDLDNKLQMGLALDQFLRGLRSEHAQNTLLNSPPDNLEEAQNTAKRLEATLAACKRMRSKKQPPVHSLERTTCGQEEDTTPAQEISAHTTCTLMTLPVQFGETPSY